MTTAHKVSVNSRSLGVAIHDARIYAGQTLQQLAAKLGIHHSQLSRIERGQFSHVSKNVQKICKLLGLDPLVPQRIEAVMLASRMTRLVTTAPELLPVFENLVDALERMKQNV